VFAADWGQVDLAYDFVAAFQRFIESGPSFPWVLLYIGVAGIPVVLIHELGHALAVSRRLAGGTEIRVGDAGKITELRLGQITASVNALSIPGRPAGQAGFDDSEATARDIVWVAVCGPAASVAAGLVAATALAAAPATGVVHDLLWAATLLGVGSVLELVPFELQEGRNGPVHRSDGRLARDAIRALRALG